ncbi:MAG: hypothetical protein ACI37T_06260 [Candidatus Gastranaerophilaceae bacterium]
MIKKFLILTFISVIFGNMVFASEEIVLPVIQKKQKIDLHPVAKKQTKTIVINSQEEISEMIKIQQQSELEDIERLWQATVDNNQLIKFTIQKLNTPEGQRRLHSSLAAKTLSAVVYGATFLPSFAGADSLVQSASFATGKLVNNFLNRSAIPKQEMISDTELIELAGTIESLQDTIISAYYNYKGSLNKLKDIRTRIVLYNKNYSNALQTGDKLEVIISSSQYEDMLLSEYYTEQEAKKYYLELERLAGTKTIEKLNLTQYAYKNAIINPEKIKKTD